MAYELACCIELKDTQVCNHLMPLAMHSDVDVLWIVRSDKPRYGDIPKARYILVPGRLRVLRWIRMLWKSIKLARRKEVKGFVSFNPFPYGVISFIAAWLSNKPVHFGLIGSDWNLHAKGRWSWLLIPILRRGAFLTIYGEAARREMIARGVDDDRIAVLPHSVALDRFPIANETQYRYAAAYVGALIPSKRISLILRGFALVLESHSEARLCIVGDGPLRQHLQELALELNIADSVDFVGFVADVQPYLLRARTLVMASQAEGFPFSIVEAVCSGVVPITTPVNAIPEILDEGVTALFFEPEDWKGMASCLRQLLDDSKRYDEIRRNVLVLREKFSFDSASAVWRPWLNELAQVEHQASFSDQAAVKR